MHILFLKVFRYSFFFPLSLFTFLAIRMISPIKTISFGLINSHRIGHFSIEWEIVFQMVKKKLINVDLIGFHKIISNKFLAKMIKRKKFVFPTEFIYLLIKFNNTFLGNKKHNINFHDYNWDTLNLLDNFKPSLQFSKNELKMGKSILENLELDKKKIVCLLVRDDYYMSKFNKQTDKYNLRNHDINNYIPLIKNLEQKGYVVFRMGRHTKQKLSYKSRNVVDYPFSKFKSDFMDIYLINKCNFVISTGFGLDGIATIFNKKIFFINYTPLAVGSVYRKKNTYTFKKFFDLNTNKYLTLSQIFKNNLAYKYLDKKYLNKNNLKLENIGQKELQDSILEFIKQNKQNKKIKLNLIQKKFNENFKKLVELYPTNIKTFGKIYPIASSKFLKNNNFFLS